jgi:hypothetical protein
MNHGSRYGESPSVLMPNTSSTGHKHGSVVAGVYGYHELAGNAVRQQVVHGNTLDRLVCRRAVVWTKGHCHIKEVFAGSVRTNSSRE